MNIDFDKLNQDIELANNSTLINQDYEKSFDLFINNVFDSSQSDIQNFKFAAILLRKIRIDNIIFNNLYKHIFYPIFKLDSSRL